MKEQINSEQLHALLLEMMESVDEFCRKHGLRYSLGGGTLLGAIRHGGFIPWDDDADLMMPREDYEFFVSHYQDDRRGFKIWDRLNDDVTYCFGFAKIYDPMTICKDQEAPDFVSIGVNIDIFPIDGIPSVKPFTLLHMKMGNYLRTLLLLRQHRSINDRMTLKDKLTFYLSRVLPAKTWKMVLDGFLKICSFDDSKTAGAVLGRYAKKEIYDQSVFAGYAEHQFEQCKFQIIKEYDIYLRQHYNDYMTLPPVEKRVSHEYVSYRKKVNVVSDDQ